MKSLANLILFIAAALLVLTPFVTADLLFHEEILGFTHRWGLLGKLAVVASSLATGFLLLSVGVYVVRRIFFPHLHVKKSLKKSK